MNIIIPKVPEYTFRKHEKIIPSKFFNIVRKIYRQILNLGFSDVFRIFNKKGENYTFWDYMHGSWSKNKGLRIDHVLCSNNIIDHIKKISQTV